ncbi:AAA family ATPase [Patescibacteria group bacterium]|nr:AAA family ATPase [Patescibacteria group bacterium]
MSLYLKRLEVEHFRGFYTKQTLVFAIPNGKKGSGLTVVVGPNNTGKTTILEAVKKFAHRGNAVFTEGERHGNKNVKLSLVNTANGRKVLTTYGGSQTKFTGEEHYPDHQSFYLISARKDWQHYFGGGGSSRNAYKQQLYGMDRLGSDGSFGQRIADIERDEQKNRQFKDIIAKLLPNITHWVVDTNDNNQRYIKYKTGTGDTHHSGFWGDGVVSLFKVAAALVPEDESEATNEILVIDEPELSLHPQLQKRLANFLSQIATDRQVVLVTHSPHFINWRDIKNGAIVLRLNKPQDRRCVISKLDKTADHYEKLIVLAADNWQKPQLMDVVAKEIFFGEKILFTEGQEDVGLIKKFIDENELDIDFEIFGYGAGGAENMKYFFEIAKDLNLAKVACLLDRGKESLEKELKRKFPSFQVDILPTRNICDKKKTIKGIFNKKGVIKRRYKKSMLKLIEKWNQYFSDETS